MIVVSGEGQQLHIVRAWVGGAAIKRVVLLLVFGLLLTGCVQYAMYTPSVADLTALAENYRVDDGCAELIQAAAVLVAWLEDVVNRDTDSDERIAKIEKILALG